MYPYSDGLLTVLYGISYSDSADTLPDFPNVEVCPRLSIINQRKAKASWTEQSQVKVQIHTAHSKKLQLVTDLFVMLQLYHSLTLRSWYFSSSFCEHFW